MKKYESITKLSVKDREENIRKYWKDIDLLEESIKLREDHESFVFYDGPPTANGKPGIHHVIARALKDTVCRYKTMKGYQVKRKAGWDTHGLPVELEVEKKLNLHNKSDIEELGIGNFCRQCKDSVFEYEAAWREQTDRMAYLIDLDDPYITLDNDYIESVWWILNKFFEEGYIYEGHKIVPYCPRCGTGLASHEVAQGYQEVKTNTVYVKFKRADADEYFLVWTTTPWTLAANVVLTMHPNETYVKVKFNDEVLIVQKDLAQTVIGGEFEVISEHKGKEFEYVRYEQIMPFVEIEDETRALYVTMGEYVTTEDGTGIVHTAPAFGEDDYNLGRKYNTLVLQPVDLEGKYTETPWKGRFVMEEGLDLEIIEWLYNSNRLLRKQKVEHNYPHCWRCKTPLVYYANPSWYIEMTKLKDTLIENNNGVNWFPDYVGEKRFGNWLENLNDWAISRTRYWGTPLNIWRCEKCGKVKSVGSRADLVNLAIEDIDESIELHRPEVDDVHLKCECGGTMTRVPEVIDCWFDSGAMPFAQMHYPFEHKDDFDEYFPADFICEGIDQTRGWFYSLLAISSFVTGKSPYKNVLVNDLILDSEGKKMSKSRGNSLDAVELFDEYGADAVRWYMYYVSPAWTPTKFDVEGLREINSKFFKTLQNVYNFFSLYANTDEIDVDTFDVPYEKRSKLDKWILSKLNNTVRIATKELEIYDLTKAVRAIQKFVDEDLSNWYIRRSRRRFWQSELNDDKKAVYQTTYEILLTVAKLSAPFAPYISEEIYDKLTGNKSVHLEDYPNVNLDFINDDLEEEMDYVRNLVTLGRASREAVKIKVRQPITKVVVDGNKKDLIEDLIPLIKEELNVKEVEFVSELGQYMNYEIKPNFKVVGPVLGKKVGLFNKALSSLDASKYAPELKEGKTITVDLGGEAFDVTEELVDIRMDAKEGFTVRIENNIFIILDTNLTDELVDEGYAREFISRIQQIRKDKDFDMMDNINIYYNTEERFDKAVKLYKDYIMKETLGLSLIESTDKETVEYELNDIKVNIFIEKK
ncbi:isoleucine--tRNA ligase [Clostridiaceae bacterium HSG29]|nr:isoleucine--tRNA ligase [Clostridiaceae bacterium HSG29]